MRNENFSKSGCFITIIAILSGLTSIRLIDFMFGKNETYNVIYIFLVSFAIFIISIGIMIYSYFFIEEKEEIRVITQNSILKVIIEIINSNPFLVVYFVLFCYANFKICENLLWWCEISFTGVSLVTFLIMFYPFWLAFNKKWFILFPVICFVLMLCVGLYDLFSVDGKYMITENVRRNEVNGNQAILFFKTYLCLGLNFFSWIPIQLLKIKLLSKRH